ncbi:MFS general substrate transporter [Hortaea werneckii]|uniref:Major facilitator superfamily (MFS) profile domain-containing protein n=1 Tax=Hortaea werneckii TaxID=91943 RepID=A0A3M7G4G2_HORWE|nr:MFS general substrate transporter [Hortaea werneckii]KAI7565074.1 MFS general substrate transporter [Hortaea werneckii]KAI7607901.1 MFS general substrate transporter [Hortaea werneckii]KAI7615750.1 MFS general substrate transporter [Hortaea werneckii]KAI7668738.1 MFS general substrate transporter [Hortaea werneckii]
MAIFKRMNLKQGNTARTNASQLTLRQSLYPICLVTILFFLWGFSYGLLDTLNKHFQTILGIDRARSAGLQAAYFGAYPLASLGHANWILRHYGFKLVFIWGLCLYGIGSLVAWPCLLYKSFGGFCAAIFIIGNGLGSLETAANPYITICGPPRYSEMRINISQAFNGIGTVVAPVLGSYVFFKNTGTGENALQNVQWVYLAIAIFVFILAVVFYFSPIPEITDADMEFQAQESHANTDDQPFWKQYRLFHAAFAQFCYTGAQVAIAGYFINYVSENRANTGDSLAAQFLAGAQGAFAMGRFIGSGIMKFVRPRWVFLVYLGLCIVFIAPSITQRGNTGLAMLFLTLFFESICFPTIVALGMRGLGKHSKRGSGWIVGGVCGGAVVPPILGAVADIYDNTAPAMSVPLAFFIAAWTYAICVNFVPAYRIPADRLGETKIGVEDAAAGIHDEENMKGGDGMFGVSSEKGGIEQVESNTNSEEIRDVR